MHDPFLVTDIHLAAIPLQCRRGVILAEEGTRAAPWSLIVYDPRPGTFSDALGLELPFRAQTKDETLLTGMVRVGASESNITILEGIGVLRTRQPWHALSVRERIGRADSARRAGGLHGVDDTA